MLTIASSTNRPTPSFKRRKGELQKIGKSLRAIAKEERVRFSSIVKEHRQMLNIMEKEEDVKVPEVVDIESYFNDEE